MVRKNEQLNIILITSDSLRADALGYWGEKKQNTPWCNHFVPQGVAFTQAIAQGPYTTTSIPSLLTGLHPIKLKPILSHDIAGVLMQGTATLAELLKNAGYHTAAFHSNPLLSRIFGYDRGFDIFYDDLFLRNLRIPSKAKLALNRLQRALRVQPYLPAKSLTQKALAWLNQAKRPFFLWLHYMDTHGPYQRRKRLRYLEKFRAERLWRKAVKKPELVTEEEKKKLREAYREEVAYLDQRIGMLFEQIDLMGFVHSSILVFTADHGEAFGEHGYFTHTHQLYEELIRVPLIIHVPEIQPRIIDKLVGLVNLTPTILDFAGVKVDESFDGHSFRPLIESGDESYLPDYIISEAEFNPYIGAIRTADWKFILNERAGTKELYNVTMDVQEQHNVIHNYPNIAEELEAKLRKHFSKGFPSKKSKGTEQLSNVDQKILDKRLRDLGYL